MFELFSSISQILSLPLILIAVRAVVAVVIATQKVTVSPSAEIFVIVLVTGAPVQAGLHVTVSPTLNFPTSAPLVIVNTLPRSGPDHRILPALIYPGRTEVARGL